MSNTEHLPALSGVTRGFYCIRRVLERNSLLGRRVPVARTFPRCDEFVDHTTVLQHAAAVLAMIAHPNIEKPLKTRFCGGVFCVTTAWANGGTLSTYLAANPSANRLRIVLGIADALAYLLSTTSTKTWVVIHGNVHVTTVLIHNGRPLLSDFSLCEIIRDPPGAGSRAATSSPNDGMITSKAPEIQDTAACSIAADVYAFGMLLFELAAGHGPFPGLTRYAAAARLLAGERPQRGELRMVPHGDAVWRIISRCWAHDPQQRPQMSVVHADLLTLLQL